MRCRTLRGVAYVGNDIRCHSYDKKTIPESPVSIHSRGKGSKFGMTAVERMARFAVNAPYDELSETARQQLKIRVLDALGCAIGALDAKPVHIIREYIREFDAGGKCVMIGGKKANPEQATLYNGAAVRYLDFNDSY